MFKEFLWDGSRVKLTITPASDIGGGAGGFQGGAGSPGGDGSGQPSAPPPANIGDSGPPQAPVAPATLFQQVKQQGQASIDNTTVNQGNPVTQPGQPGAQPPAAAPISPELEKLYSQFHGQRVADTALKVAAPFFAGQKSGLDTINEVFTTDKGLAAKLTYGAIERFGNSDNFIKHLAEKHPQTIERFLQANGYSKTGAPGSAPQPAGGASAVPPIARSGFNPAAAGVPATQPSTIPQVNLEEYGLTPEHPVMQLIEAQNKQIQALTGNYQTIQDQWNAMTEKQQDDYLKGVEETVNTKMDGIIHDHIKTFADLGAEQADLQSELFINISAKIFQDPKAMEYYNSMKEAEALRNTFQVDNYRDLLVNQIRTLAEKSVKAIASPYLRANQQVHNNLNNQRGRVNPPVQTGGFRSAGNQPQRLGSLVAHVKANPITGR